jgi:holo-[acyl-carrier protein] synthase
VIVGSGVDVVEIARIERALERGGARFERRVYTEGESAACRRFARPAPHFALRFAAKEAAIKAVARGVTRGTRWLDFETLSEGPEGLRLVLHGRAAEIARDLGRAVAHLAVGRSRDLALAVVVLEAGTP